MDTSSGIDVSSYQGTQNWASLASGGLTFAFAKASEGQHTRDPKFAAHIQGIIAAGLVPGAYHYGWPNQSASNEAANYIAAVRPYARKGFVHALDLERRTDGANYTGASASAIRAYATAWIAAVRRAFPGQRVGIYTSGSDITAGHYPAGADFLWYPAYPAGAMTYAQAAARSKPSPGGKTPLFWQFTSTPGDRNIAYLSPAALRAWAAGTNPTTPTEDDDMPVTPAEMQKIAQMTADLMITPKYRDAQAGAVLYWLADAVDPSRKLPTGDNLPGVVATVTQLRPVIAAMNNADPALIDKLRQAIAETVVRVDVSGVPAS